MDVKSLFGGRNSREAFFNYLAKGLTEAAKQQKNSELVRDHLLQDISFAFLRRRGRDLYQMYGNDDELGINTSWIPDTIEQLQNTWKKTRRELPVDLMKGENAPVLLELVEALGRLERTSRGERKG